MAMAEYFLDTNVFLRYLTDDLPEQAQAVEQILQRAAKGKVALRTNALVIAEIVWTLESYYERSRAEIREQVLAIVNTPGLDVENADIITEAAFLYADQNVDFIDAYNACWMKREGLARVYTFDVRHYRRFEGIRPQIPEVRGRRR
jgi:predicted nucleic-acid-binding protein